MTLNNADVEALDFALDHILDHIRCRRLPDGSYDDHDAEIGPRIEPHVVPLALLRKAAQEEALDGEI